MGMTIAKMQMGTLWKEMLARFGRFEQVAPPQRKMWCRIYGYLEVRVRLSV
jgi:cytochrome P450